MHGINLGLHSKYYIILKINEIKIFILSFTHTLI